MQGQWLSMRALRCGTCECKCHSGTCFFRWPFCKDT
jgi:hypothetical protein